MSITPIQEAAPYALGAAAVTNPIWLNILQPGYQYTIGALGFVMIILTIRNKWLEIKIKQNILKNSDKE